MGMTEALRDGPDGHARRDRFGGYGHGGRGKLAELEAVEHRDARTRTLRIRLLAAPAIRAWRGIPPHWEWKYEPKDA